MIISKTFREAWRVFNATVLDEESPEDREKMEEVFYAGACTFMRLSETGTNVEAMKQELRNHMDHVIASADRINNEKPQAF